ncbi:MAG TPA: SHOCT domain-containing protein [Streptosporangiaceae bacterium]|nr:SHOCT domain-containing protein [Streptosporangiaceae bacterium]
MFGHKHEHDREWTHFGGIVADSRQHHRNWTYLVDYRRAEGGTFRVTVPALPDQNVELRIGTQVQLEVDLTSGEARLVPGQVLGAGGPGAREARRLTVQMGGAGDRAADVAAALGNLGQPGVHLTGSTEVRVVGGSEVRVVGGAQAAEVMAAVQDLMSGGDPAAARERIRHLKADLQAQAGLTAPAGPAGFSSPEPSTFDIMTPPSAPPPTTFSSPDPSVGQAGPAFGPPGFNPVAPVTTFSSPASTGSFGAESGGSGAFGAGGSAGSSASGAFGDFGATKSDRIARLEDQRDRGQITPEQFAAQRQQIQDEI